MAFHTRNLNQFSVPSRPTFSHAARYIYHEGAGNSSASVILNRFPILKFYRGFTVTVIGIIPYAGVSFLSWGFLRSRLLPPSKVGHKEATLMADLCIGAVSGAIAQTSSYPFEVIRRRMQVGGITNPDRWLRWNETVKTIWQSSGWRGFYVGLGIGYLKVIPMTAVSFTVWQGCKRLFNV
jgi:solute carrier family 25 protein 16